jgi:putative hydroxymethylpyrimidine transport system ATP-binding protein
VKTYDITVEELSLSYSKKKIFDQFSFHLSSGQCAAILGTSGVGKSTLLNSIAGLTTGCSTLSKKIKPTSSGALISYMTQKPSLLPWLNVMQNMLISKKLARQTITDEEHNKAARLLAQVQLSNSAALYPQELSGGMYQRVALARALFEEKPIILMDEPFSSLDVITRLDLQTLANTLLKDKTVLLVTHDPLEALRMADVIYVLHGTPATLSEPIKPAVIRAEYADHPELLAQHAQLLNILRAQGANAA